MILPPYAELLGLTVEPGAQAPVLVMPLGDGVLGRPGYPARRRDRRAARNGRGGRALGKRSAATGSRSSRST